MARSERTIRKELTEVGSRQAELRAELDEARRRKRIKCEKCGKGTQVSKLIYVQTRWYVAPYSCTGGDYWKDGEGQFMCPKCEHVNRLYDKPEIVKLKSHFREVRQGYKSRQGLYGVLEDGKGNPLAYL